MSKSLDASALTVLAMSAARGVPKKVLELAQKFAPMVGVAEFPDFEIRNNMSSSWLGRCHMGGPGFRRPRNLIEIQKRALHEERTLSRVVAHEICHHAEFLELGRAGIVPTARFRRLEPSHGPRWQKYADKVNRVMGEDYVAVLSDALVTRGELAPTVRPYLMKISPFDSREFSRYGYSIAARLTPKATQRMSRLYAFEKVRSRPESRFIMSTDARWTQGKIPNIGSGKVVLPTREEDQKALEALYKKAVPLETMYPLLARGSG
jgi:hypothetical protein